MSYIKKQECDKVKGKTDWDKIRQKFLSRKEKGIINTNNCKHCVWANEESGKIFCSRYKCTEGKNYV